MILLTHGIKKIDSKKVERNTGYQRLERVQEQEGWIKAWSMGTELVTLEDQFWYSIA